ncbi:MAG: lasso peptide biosynthesis B2 protein [Thermoleophilaceae bacterium]
METSAGHASRLIPAQPRRLSVTQKLSLVAEILRSYRRARRELGREDLRLTLRTLRGEPAPRRPEPLDPETYGEALRMGSVVSRVCRPLPIDSRCLTQSLVLTALLSRRGVGSSLVIGVRRGESFGAHAWVELDGRAVLPTGAGAFERLVEL